MFERRRVFRQPPLINRNTRYLTALRFEPTQQLRIAAAIFLYGDTRAVEGLHGGQQFAMGIGFRDLDRDGHIPFAEDGDRLGSARYYFHLAKRVAEFFFSVTRCQHLAQVPRSGTGQKNDNVELSCVQLMGEGVGIRIVFDGDFDHGRCDYRLATVDANEFRNLFGAPAFESEHVCICEQSHGGIVTRVVTIYSEVCSKMRLGLNVVVCGLLLSGSLATAQAVNNNPAASDKPVFLDNHGPKKTKDKAPTTRNLSGKVVDINGTPLEGALVTLTNTKTNNKTTFITKKDGRYEFNDLSFSVDYELGARYKTFSAPERKLSQYDHNPNVVRILQVDDTANGSGASEAKSNTQSPR